MKKLLILSSLMLTGAFAKAQYTAIQGKNTTTSTIYLAFTGDTTGSPTPCVPVLHTLPTGPLTTSYVTFTPGGVSWVGGMTSSTFNRLNIVRALSGGGTEASPQINLCTPLKPPFTVTFPVSGTVVTVSTVNLGGGLMRVDVY